MSLNVASLDKKEKAMLTQAISKAIGYVAEKCPPVTGWTDQMSRECFHKCLGIYEVLRYDLEFSPIRSCDELPNALRCYLEDIPWEPKQTNSWITTDDNEMSTPGGIILPGY